MRCKRVRRPHRPRRYPDGAGRPIRFLMDPGGSKLSGAAALVLTALVLAAGAQALSGSSWNRPLPARTYLVKVSEEKVEIPDLKPPAPPPPKAAPEPEIKPAKPVDKPKPPPKPKARRETDRKKKRTPARSSAPRTHTSSDKPSREPVKEVFGVDPNTVAQGGPPAPVGNTLLKEPDEEFTPPKKVKSVYNPPETDRAPSYKKVIKPSYPRAARLDGIEGVVKISLVVDESGRPTQLRVTKGVGHGLDEAALSAVSQYRFSPGLVDGQPVKVRVVVPIKFQLEN